MVHLRDRIASAIRVHARCGFFSARAAPEAALSRFGCHKGSVLTVLGRSGLCIDERRSVMLYAAIDIHKHSFQAAVLEPETGVVVEDRFSADRESLARWAEPWRGRVAAVAIEATTGWRWVWRELVERGFEVRLAEPVQTRALPRRRRSAQTDRLRSRLLAPLPGQET